MKWVSHRDYRATIMALQSRIDALEAQVAFHHEALDAIESIHFRTVEIVPVAECHEPEFSTQGNVIIADFNRRND